MTWKERLALAVYRSVTPLLKPWLLQRMRRRAQAEPLYGQFLNERWGLYSADVLDALRRWQGQRPIWIHGVSLGETRAAVELIAAYAQSKKTEGPLVPQKAPREARTALLLTHGTATGRSTGAAWLSKHAEALGIDAIQVWQPWDSPAAVQRFLDTFLPERLWLMETEVWPTLVHATLARDVPVSLVNARLSPKSLAQAQRLKWLSRPAYAAISQAFAQTDEDATRLRALGVNVRAVVGNIKFDARPDAKAVALGQRWRDRLTNSGGRRAVVAFASSREGEELQFLKAFAAYGAKRKASLISRMGANSGASAAGMPLALIVPRHPQRFDEVSALAHNHGFMVARRSEWRNDQPDTDALTADIWIGDSLGEMAAYATLADLALLGGSFAPLGGQNLIELLACGCPVVMGPHTFNFAESAEGAEAAGVGMRVQSLEQGVEKAGRLLEDPAELADLRCDAARFVQKNAGALQKTLERLQS